MKLEGGDPETLESGTVALWIKLFEAIDSSQVQARDAIVLNFVHQGGCVSGMPAKFDKDRVMTTPDVMVDLSFRGLFDEYEQLPDPEVDERKFEAAHDRMTLKVWAAFQTHPPIRRSEAVCHGLREAQSVASLCGRRSGGLLRG